MYGWRRTVRRQRPKVRPGRTGSAHSSEATRRWRILGVGDRDAGRPPVTGARSPLRARPEPMARLLGTTHHMRLPSSQAEQGLRPCQKTATRGPHALATDHPIHPLRPRRRRRRRPAAGGRPHGIRRGRRPAATTATVATTAEPRHRVHAVRRRHRGSKSALTSRATTDPVRHVVQRRSRRRRLQRHGVAQERRHVPDAGVDEQAGHGIQRPHPLRPGQALDDPGARRVGREPASSCVGSGDPSLSSANLDAMAKTTAAVAARAKEITPARVYVDDDVFPDPDAGLRVEGELRARLDRAGARPGARPAQQLRHQRRGRPLLPRPAQGLRRDGRRLLRPRQRGRRLRRCSRAAPARPLSTMVSTMLLNSDNEIAESLHKLVSRQLGYGASWSGARTAQAKQLAAQGLQDRHALRRLGAVPRRPAHRPAARPDRRPRHRRPAPRPRCGR